MDGSTLSLNIHTDGTGIPYPTPGYITFICTYYITVKQYSTILTHSSMPQPVTS